MIRSASGILRLLALTAALALLALRGAVAGDEASNLDDVLKALRSVVDDPSWQVVTETMTREQLTAGAANGPPVPLESAALASVKKEWSLKATAPGRDGNVVAFAILCDDAGAAERVVKAFRTAIEAAAAKLAGERGLVFELLDGAGGALGGFRVALTRPNGAASTQVALRVFSRGSTAVFLSVVDAPEIDADAQVEALVYADAWIADPSAAKSLPRPKPRPARLEGPMLRVRVVDPDGKPVPRARVAIGVAESYHAWTAEARDGVVEFARSVGEVRVFVWGAQDAEGKPLPLSPSDAMGAGADWREVEVRLATGVEIAGTVRDAKGEPATGARVEATPQSTDEGWGGRILIRPEPHGAADVGADGSFRIVGLAQIGYRLRVTRGGAPITTRDTDAVGGARAVEIVLRAPTVVRLRILDPEGKPVEGVVVSAFAEGMDPRARWGESKSDGVAALDTMEAGTAYELTLAPPASRDDLAVTTHLAWMPRDGDVRIDRGWTMRGVVQDTEGKPVAGRVERRDRRAFDPVVETDAGGAFEIRGLPMRAIEVAAFAADAPRFRGEDAPQPEWRKVEAGTASVTLRAAHVAPKDLSIRVLDAEGRPVPLASLRVLWHGGDWGESIDVVNGTATFEAPGDPFGVEVRGARTRDGISLGLAPFRKEGLEGGGALEIKLVPGVAITGTVRDAGGRPVAGATCAVISLSDEGRLGSDTRFAHASTESDAAGAFRLEGLAKTRYVLIVRPRAPNAEPDATAVDAPSDGTVVTLPKATAMRIVDWDGRPVKWARLAVHEPSAGTRALPGRVAAVAMSDADGQAWLRAFPPEVGWLIDVAPPGERDDLIPIHWPELPPPGSTIRMEHGFTLRCFVHDDGGPIFFAEVEGRGAAADSPFKSLGHTGLDGKLEMKGCPVGIVKIRVRGKYDDPPVSSEWIDVQPKEGVIDIRVAPPR